MVDAKAALKKFEKDNNIVEEDLYSFNEAEYDKLLSSHPWKAKYFFEFKY